MSPSNLEQFLDTPYQIIQRDQYRSVTPTRLAGHTYLHLPPLPIYAT